MKIDDFYVNLDSSRTYTLTQSTQVSNAISFRSVFDDHPPSAATENSQSGMFSQVYPVAEISKMDESTLSSWQEVGELSLTQQFKIRLNNLRQMAIDMIEQVKNRLNPDAKTNLKSLNQVYTGAGSSSGFNMLTQWEQTRTTTFRYEENEQVSVSAQGTVYTADNRQIDFSMDLFMDRQYVNESTTTETETGYMFIDPLVIQTEAQTPMLQGAEFCFDLDCDGEDENLAGLSQGYAFLALDLNQDGIINDGSELFGPSTGNGFQELADYDDDENMWIDENDAMFDQFVLWNPSSDEAMRLTKLKDADVGAIYLGEVSSLFSLSSQDQQMAAQITDTSLALTELGDVMPVYEMKYKV
ncbi:hypothetical protein [Desulfobacter vibrioformis]|uniref:hypothetical protein n=1 Tax=Desulfobacter vibrioformis TaxID=34031 RepID=UPI00069099CD|nr:hypothetical protein [Desulfobacter vibrioformis]